MKIFIDTIKWVILKEEKESPFFEGENFASKLRIYVNDNGDSYPTLSLLKANGRKRGPFNYDASGYGTEVVEGIEWNYYDFTLSTINGALDVPGQLLMTCIINTNGSQRAFNFTNNVVKTAIDADSGIIVYGDDPTDIINDIGKNLDTYQKSVDEHNKAINNINSELNDKVSLETFDRRTEETTEFIKNTYISKDSLIQYLDEDATDSRKYATKEELPTKVSDLENDTDYVDSERLTDVVDSLEAQIKRNGGKNYYLSGYTSSNGIRELATTLYDYDEEFQSTNVGKFYVELGDGTIIENLYLKRFSGTQGVNYYLNSIIRENNTIKVYLGTLPRTSMTISDFINKHSQIATMQDIADLVNSAPETLDTLGEIANALKDNKDVVEALNNAIGNKADITYVDEKIPTDLLDRVETLETLSDEAVYMEDTEFDVEEETGGSVGSGKEIVEITTPLLKIEQTPYGEHINFEFKNEWNNKYIIYDWSIDQQTFDMAQDLKYIIINSSEKILTNLTILIKVPYMGGIINNDMTYFEIYTPKGFVFVENFFNAKTYHEGCRYLDNDNFNYCRYAFEAWDGGYHFIKIDFDDYGFATVYLFDEYEV